MKKNTLGICVILVGMLLLISCTSAVRHPVYDSASAITTQTLAQNELSIQYLGVQGHLLRFNQDALMTAPSFTNPPFHQLAPFIPIATNTQLVDKYLPDVSNVSMILVGHAHYDHLMDVPYIMQRYAKNAHVYGSNTMKHSIASAVSQERLHPLNAKMATQNKMGEWVYNQAKSIRIMAVESMHAPHFMGINVMTGRYQEDLTSLPWHSFAWKEGQTLAFLIDFLDQDEIKHRVFFQDSASEAPKTLMPQALLDQHPIDIAIITPASFQQVNNYPEYIMQHTQAKHFILGHWEDFFGNVKLAAIDKPRFVRASNQALFFKRFKQALPEGSSWVMPAMFSVQTFDAN